MHFLLYNIWPDFIYYFLSLFVYYILFCFILYYILLYLLFTIVCFILCITLFYLLSILIKLKIIISAIEKYYYNKSFMSFILNEKIKNIIPCFIVLFPIKKLVEYKVFQLLLWVIILLPQILILLWLNINRLISFKLYLDIYIFYSTWNLKKYNQYV